MQQETGSLDIILLIDTYQRDNGRFIAFKIGGAIVCSYPTPSLVLHGRGLHK